MIHMKDSEEFFFFLSFEAYSWQSLVYYDDSLLYLNVRDIESDLSVIYIYTE